MLSQDHSWDPTKVFKDTEQAKRAEKRWMRIEGGGTRGSRRRRREERSTADSTGDAEGESSVRQDRGRDHRSPAGQLLHEANVRAAEDQTLKQPVKAGSLALLSNNLGSILGW